MPEPKAERDKPIVEPWDEHNRELVSHVHPHDWVNPEPAERYHLVVIGAGTAGLISAIIANGAGGKVALVERHLMGGDCLNVGCVPSKGVIAAARAWRVAKGGGTAFGAPRAEGEGDFGAAMERMRRIRAGISPIDGAARYRDQGIDVFLGEARFIAADAIEVGGARLHFRRAVVATGGRAAAPPIPGLDEVDYLTNETIFSLTEKPERLGVIGGGPIGCELSQSFARLGSRVTLFDRNEHVLGREDPDAAAVVQEAMAKDGVELCLGVGIQKIEKKGEAEVVVFERGGKAERIEVDRLLVAAGRRPNVEGLGLEAAGVKYGKRGVEVDDRLQTTNSKIYACGDVAAKYQFTHLAEAQAKIVVQNALFFRRLKASDLVVPWCTYTSPEIAHVGLYEKDAKERGHEVETLTIPLEDNDRARLEGETEGFLRVHLKKGSDKILGATLVAAHAGDLLSPMYLAVTHGIGLEKFASTIFPYPTQGEIYKAAASAYQKKKLTPTVQKILDFWMRVFK